MEFLTQSDFKNIMEYKLTELTQKKMNKTQIIGIGIIIIGIAAYFLTGNNIVHTISGALSTIGLSFVFKWIPFRKRKLSK
ncbi:MAG: hypothetical protein ACJAVD_000320 [Porticoccaceae bacterium]